MTQGNSSQYPVLVISLSIMAICYLVSLLISILCDLLYDFYLVKFSKTEQKNLIENRVKSDFKRLRQFFKSQKLEKFDPSAARNRLTIINSLLMEKINSKENKPYLEPVKTKQQQQPNATIKKSEKNFEITKDESKQESIKPQEIKKLQTKEEKISSRPKEEFKIEEVKKPQQNLQIKRESPKPEQKIEIKKEEKKIQTQAQATQTISPVPPVQENKSKNSIKENKLEKYPLETIVTVDEAIKQLSNAPRTAKVLFEIKESKTRESSAKKVDLKFTPSISNKKEDKSKMKEKSESVFSRDETAEIKKYSSLSNSPRKSDIEDAIEMLGKKTTLNQNLSKAYRENQLKLQQERLKLDAEFRKTRHSSPEHKIEHKKKYKYDDEKEDDEEETKVNKYEFE